MSDGGAVTVSQATGMRPSEVIARKRDGHELDEVALRAMIDGLLSGEVDEAQIAALLMAGVINGFSSAEAHALTAILWSSGQSLDLSSLDGVTVDKHSTGGVADGTTLLIAPLVAAAGAYMVKLSGRGLGHTGGTLDKLESIPGMRVEMEPARILDIAADVGCVVAAQSDELVPADRALYALRDLTATVDSPALIASSVMSKKLASGAGTIVLDVKVGDGAFIREPDEAEDLARLCVDLGQESGRRCAALVTDMDQPLGRRIGNALEIAEAVALLRRPPAGRLATVALELAATAMSESQAQSAAGSDDVSKVRDRLIGLWERGDALEHLERMIAAQGGDPKVCSDPDGVLPAAAVRREVVTTAGGTVTAVPARRIGELVARLGAGRARKGDQVDPAVGIDLEVEVGDEIDAGQRIATVHAGSEADALTVVDGLQSAIVLGGGEPQVRDVIVSRVIAG